MAGGSEGTTDVRGNHGRAKAGPYFSCHKWLVEDLSNQLDYNISRRSVYSVYVPSFFLSRSISDECSIDKFGP